MSAMATLYHYPLCPHSRFIRLVLGEFGMDAELVEERVWERRREFLELNTAGTTPVFQEQNVLPVPGAGPIAAGDTARWIIGDTESGSGTSRRVHILVKPSRPDISTNLVVTTDRRTYMIELRAREALYMPSVSWSYPALPAGQRQTVPAAPIIPVEAARNYRYGLTGDTPPWRPISVFDDGRRVYVVFPRGIVQGEMPPIFVIGSEGETQIVNSRIHQNILIVDRLFGAAELRLGSGKQQQTVRIVRIEQRQAAQPAKTGEQPS